MIDKEILNAVRLGVITDEELDIALKHYRGLETMLKPHGERYHLVWLDVRNHLDTLENFKLMRKEK